MNDIKAIIADEVKRVVKSELEKLNTKITELENINRRLNEKIKILESKLDRTEIKIERSDAEREKQANLQLVKMKDDLNALVATEIQPQLNTLKRFVAEQTLDGTELVTQYRHRVMKTHGQGKLAITSNTQTSYSNTAQFVFNDQD